MEVSLLVSVLWQDRDQDINLQDQGHGTKVQDQDGGSKNLP